MENSPNQVEWPDSIYNRWVFLPVLAHLLSLLAGWGWLLAFPVLVTVAHYLTIKQYSAVVRPGLWFITLPISVYVWVRWGPVHYLHPSEPDGNGIIYGVLAYYVGQLINAFFIPILTEKPSSATGFTSNSEGINIMLYWMLATVLSAGTWVTLYFMLNKMTAGTLEPGRGDIWNVLGILIYPAISLVANALSGLLLTKHSTIPDDE